jgi:hypothetical protein
MQSEWFRGAAITVRYDDERRLVLFVANNGRVPTLELPVTRFLSATADGPLLELAGAFERDTKIALKIGPADAGGIARVLVDRLQLPRQPVRASIEELARIAEEMYVVVEGRCWSLATHGVLGERIALLDCPIRIEFNAPYRITGFYRRGEREEIRVVAMEHLNPPVTWFVGETVRVMHLPERELIGLVPVPPHRFTEPAGTLELYLPPRTLATIAVDGDALVFDGDFSQTNYGKRVRIAPVSERDARAIFTLLDEKFQVPRSPRRITVADVPSIATATYVQIDGTFQFGHVEGPNFDGDIQLQDRDVFEIGARYRVTGFLYPRFVPQGPFIGYTGPRLCPIAIERL